MLSWAPICRHKGGCCYVAPIFWSSYAAPHYTFVMTDECSRARYGAKPCSETIRGLKYPQSQNRPTYRAFSASTAVSGLPQSHIESALVLSRASCRAYPYDLLSYAPPLRYLTPEDRCHITTPYSPYFCGSSCRIHTMLLTYAHNTSYVSYVVKTDFLLGSALIDAAREPE